ncbi:hypothetical protein EDD18DRAFT_1105363 [Armillaria luteobubalina]|uniref:DNA polymerase epsilon subunit D n=1 Tax=Armillaria luteobubalina TaxID=153913 RepID=A0AA39UPK3_9AGAR|nr:hypothetical protein EDD18DRAFT_1105363 [Armillaria luteobubalina]
MPRKSQVDLISISGIVSAQAQQELVTEGLDNFELPKSLVTSIARSALPDNAKLPKDTILALVKGSTVAYDVAMSKQHKSISAADVIRALEVLELGDMIGTIQEDLQAFREEQRAAGKNDSGSAPPSRRLSVQPGAPTIRIKPPKKDDSSRATSSSSYSRRQEKDEEQRQGDQGLSPVVSEISLLALFGLTRVSFASESQISQQDSFSPSVRYLHSWFRTEPQTEPPWRWKEGSEHVQRDSTIFTNRLGSNSITALIFKRSENAVRQGVRAHVMEKDFLEGGRGTAE